MLVAYHAAAVELAGVLRSTFDDLNLCVQYVSNLSAYEHVDSVEARQQRVHLNQWVERARALVGSAEHGLTRLAALEQKVATDLAAIGGPLPVATPEPRDVLADFQERPPASFGGGYADFDPREPASTWLPKRPDDVTIIGDNEGIRIGSIRLPEWSANPKIIGVTTDEIGGAR